MFSPQYLENCGISPSTRFLTSYTHDFRPFHLRYPQRGTWDNRDGDLYETTSQPFTSGVNRSQISDSILPVVTRPFSLPTLREATWGVGYAPINAWTQQITIPRETRFSYGDDWVWGSKGNIWKQQEPLQMPYPLYDEGMLMWLSRLHGISCDNFLKSYFRRDRRLQGLPNLPAELSPYVISKDAEEREHSGVLWDFSRSPGVKDYPSHPPAFTQCSCCGLECECQHYSVPHSSFPSPSHTQPSHHSMGNRRMPQLTEYQASYSAPF